MKTNQQTILLTGFGPFPGVPHNVSAIVAQRLGTLAREAIPNARILTATLPTVWRQAPLQLDGLYFEHRPDVVLHFGVSHLAHAVTIECRARNRADRPDASGDGPLFDILTPDGPDERAASVPAGRLVARLRRRNIPAVLSHDAGHYLCNAILYHSLALMQTLGINGHCGFIHLPTKLPSVRQPPQPMLADGQLSYEDTIEAGLEILATLMHQPPHRRAPTSKRFTGQFETGQFETGQFETGHFETGKFETA